MNRRWLLIVGLAALAIGCNRKPPDPAVKHSGSHQVERPITQPTTVITETPGTAVAISPVPPTTPVPPFPVPPAVSPEFVPAAPAADPDFPRGIGPTGSPPSTAFVPLNPAPEPAAAPPPLPTATEPRIPRDVNPLRSADPPAVALPDLPRPDFAPARPNPLRSFSAEPPLASPLRSSDPVGGSAPPEATFPALPVAPSLPTATAPDSAVPYAPGTTVTAPSSEQEQAAAEAALLAQRRALQELAAAEAAKSTRPITPLAPQAALAAPPLPYDVVQVFYGTDRQATEPPALTTTVQIGRWLPAACGLMVTLALLLIAVASRRRAMWGLAACGILATGGLAWQATAGTIYELRRLGHAGIRYTTARNERAAVEVGICSVTIPKIHKTGELETPSILKLEVREDVSKHVTVQKIERLADEAFYQQLQARVGASPERELFVFVHGFNVSFEDAARRTAQIHKDLKFPGAPVFFSWPAHDKFVLTYKADEGNVEWAVPHLKKFLLDVTRHSGAKSIHLIAHSMGNRALTGALGELQAELRGESRLFNQVILAAPDIDAKRFRDVIAPAMTRTAERITLYASARDEALMASQLLHRGPRAGDAGRGLVVMPGIETIDVTPIDTSPWGHTYYGSSDPVLRDLSKVLLEAAKPTDRNWLAPADHGGLPYWVFTPIAATAQGPSATPR
ncbi:MAG: alpha/beta hydrolase [Pirellulaceae bacterium]|nr:alpha/beta hydrolase [Pirellulaceae bacterium]